MPEYTVYLNLIKPVYEEWADVADLNQNFDVLDVAVNGKVDRVEDGQLAIVSSSAPSNPSVDTLWYDKTLEVLRRWDGSSWVTMIFESDGTYQNIAEKGAANGYAPLNASGFVPSGHLDLSATLASYQAISQKGQANGYAPLNASGRVPAVHIPENLAAYEWLSRKGQPNGYAPLDENGLVPSANFAVDFGEYQATAQKGQPDGYAPLDGGGNVPLSNLSGVQVTSEKGQVGGYAPLDGTGRLPEANLTEHLHDEYPRYVIHGDDENALRPTATLVMWIGSVQPVNAEPWDPVFNYNAIDG